MVISFNKILELELERHQFRFAYNSQLFNFEGQYIEMEKYKKNYKFKCGVLLQHRRTSQRFRFHSSRQLISSRLK